LAAGWAMPPETALAGVISLPLWTCVALLILAGFGVVRPGAEKWGIPLAVTLGLPLCGFLLAAKWQGMTSSDVILAGLLPNSDAAGYFAGALHFLQQGGLSPWTTRRPLSVLHLAGLLDIGGSLHLALITLGISVAAAIAMVIAAIGRNKGLGLAAGTGAVLIPFYFPTLGSVMSENVGLTLGLCGFALMWTAISGRDRSKLFALGLGIMALGLAARAGAMFVLPVSVFFAGWQFRGESRFSLTAAGLSLLAVALAFSINWALLSLYGAEGGGGFSNFAFTLYGLVSGGHDWTWVYQQFPKLYALPEGEQAREVYHLALAHLAAHPVDLLSGILRRYNDFIFNARWYRIEGIGGLRYALTAIAVAGLVHIVRRRDTHASFILAGTIGTLLSVPFLGDGGVRVHAATIAFSAVLLGYGMRFILSRFRPANPPDPDAAGTELLPVALAVILVMVPVAWAALSPVTADDHPAPDARSCAKGAYMELATLPDAGIDITTSAQLDSVRSAVLPHGTLPEEMTTLQPPIRIGRATPLDGKIHTFKWIVSKPGVHLPTHFGACTRQRGKILYLDIVRARP
jgi:hypothetical protein